MTNAERQIALLEDRIRFLKTFDKMVVANSSFKEVSQFIMSPENQDVAEKKVFIRQLATVMQVHDVLSFDDD
jgi:hypothetical protein